MINRINDGPVDTQQILGVQRSQGINRPAAGTAALLGGPAARLDEYTPSGEQAAGLMIAVLERAAEQGVTDDAAEAMELLAATAEQAGEAEEMADEVENTTATTKTPEELAAAALAQAAEAEEAQEALDEEGEGTGLQGAKGKDAAAPTSGSGPNTTKATSETHCFCEGAKHDKEREGSEECYAIITAMTDAAGNPVDSPEVGQRKLLNDLE